MVLCFISHSYFGGRILNVGSLIYLFLILLHVLHSDHTHVNTCSVLIMILQLQFRTSSVFPTIVSLSVLFCFWSQRGGSDKIIGIFITSMECYLKGNQESLCSFISMHALP